MRLRHTSLWLQRISLLFRFSFFVFLSLCFSACLGGNEVPGGGLTPDAPSGHPGNYGAPPVAIPGPIALNMNAITIAAPDGTGQSSVSVEAGAGTAGNLLQVKNLGDVAWYAPIRKVLISSAYALGETLSADIAADGSVLNPLKVSTLAGEWLEFRQCLKSDPKVCGLAYRVEVPATGSLKGTSGVSSAPPTDGKSMKMTVDPKGNVILFDEDAGARRWNWTRLFVGTAHAEEGGSEFSAT